MLRTAAAKPMYFCIFFIIKVYQSISTDNSAYSWLEKRDIFQLFEDDSQGSDKDIREIRQLLNHEEFVSNINLQS